MTDHDFVLTALKQVNPRLVGSAGREGEWSTSELLLQIEQRSGTMQTTERETRVKPSPEPGRRRGLWVAAAVLVVAVIAAGVVIAVAGGDDDPDVAGSSVLASAESVQTAFNQGDFEAFRALFAPGFALGGELAWDFFPKPTGPVPSVTPDSIGLRIEAECTETSPTSVQCTWSQRGGIYERAGIDATVGVSLAFDEQGAIWAANQIFISDWNHLNEFPVAFGSWLRDTHPDVFEATYRTFLPEPLAGDAIDTLESRAQWAAVLDEFLAQSDVYPLGG